MYGVTTYYVRRSRAKAAQRRLHRDALLSALLVSLALVCLLVGR